MRALVWIAEDSWKPTVTAAAEFLTAEAKVTLLYVRAGEAESVTTGALHGLLGRRKPIAGSVGRVAVRAERTKAAG